MTQQALQAMAPLLDRMQAGPTVPQGWDVALHLSEAAVQALVRHNWDNAAQPCARAINWIAPGIVDGHHQVVDLQADLPPPDVTLDSGAQAARVAFAVESGILRVGQAPAHLVRAAATPADITASDAMVWHETIPITPAAPVTVQGQAPVGTQAAADGTGFAIRLDLTGAQLGLSGPEDGGISSRAPPPDVQSWVQAEDLTGVIARLAASADGGGTEQTLRPAQVSARVVSAAGGASVLQLLTATGAQPAPQPGSDLAPHSQDHDFTLAVGSQATAGMIANGYNAGIGEVKLDLLPPSEGRAHWALQVREPMIFEGTFGIEGGDTLATDHAALRMRFGGSTDRGLALFTHIEPGATVQLQLQLDAHYPLAIGGSGTAQTVGLTEGGQSVTAHGFYETIVQPQLESFLTGEIRTDMTHVKMTALSDLVLRDLALSGHQLQFEIAALPGELLVAGSLVPQP